MQHYSDKSDIEGLIRIQKALTKIGHTRFYYGLARTYEMMDQHEQAIGFYQKAVEAGHHNSYLKYFALLIRMHRDQEAIKVALQAIENGYEEIYPVAIHACNTYHMYKDSLLFLDSALKSGYTHVQDILRSSKRHGPIFHALKIAFEKALAYGQDFDDQLYAYFFTDSEPDDDRPSGPMN